VLGREVVGVALGRLLLVVDHLQLELVEVGCAAGGDHVLGGLLEDDLRGLPLLTDHVFLQVVLVGVGAPVGGHLEVAFSVGELQVEATGRVGGLQVPI